MLPGIPGERSLGLIETARLARGVVCADAMVKTAPVRLTLVEPVSRGRMLVAVDGSVAPVEAALAKGIAAAGADLVDALFIPDLHPEVPAVLQTCPRREVGEAVGLIETGTAAAAIRAADAACKTADIRLIRLRLAQGIAGKGFLQLTGTMAEVTAAVQAAAEAVEFPEILIQTEIIPSPHPDLKKWLARSLRGDTPSFDPPPGD
jgi:microcompartment protein CcmL/EutN